MGKTLSVCHYPSDWIVTRRNAICVMKFCRRRAIELDALFSNTLLLLTFYLVLVYVMIDNIQYKSLCCTCKDHN